MKKIEKAAFFFLSNYPTKVYTNFRIEYCLKRKKGTGEKKIEKTKVIIIMFFI
jgi:hypothetical protein